MNREDGFDIIQLSMGVPHRITAGKLLSWSFLNFFGIAEQKRKFILGAFIIKTL
jgi:hypothetical protein